MRFLFGWLLAAAMMLASGAMIVVKQPPEMGPISQPVSFMI